MTKEKGVESCEGSTAARPVQRAQRQVSPEALFGNLSVAHESMAFPFEDTDFPNGQEELSSDGSKLSAASNDDASRL